MSGYINIFICKTANVLTHVTARIHVAPIWDPQHGVTPRKGVSRFRKSPALYSPDLGGDPQ